jgi:CRP-like cAMP-binding protein
MATERNTVDRRGNAILNALPTDVRERVMRHMTPVSLKIKTVLFEPGEVTSDVHFPLSGVISLVTPLQEGNVVEVATVGNEGIVGGPFKQRGLWQSAPSPRWLALRCT